MAFSDIQNEVKVRCDQYLSDTRVKRLINEAYHDLCNRFPWPFLEVTTTGSAPLAITDLQEIESVFDSTNQNWLSGVDRRDIVRLYGDVTTAGTPDCWYFDGDTIRVYPVAVVSLSVRYVKYPTDLSADSDTPIVPARFTQVLTDLASAKAQRAAGRLDQAAVTDQVAEAGVQRMAVALDGRDGSGPEFIFSTSENC